MARESGAAISISATWHPETAIFLPVFHQGARFYLGDVHASQGDTEFTGTAAETKATVRLRLELEKGKRMPGMRIEKPDSLIAIHAERPLDLAVETATIHLMDWLISRAWIVGDRRVLPGQHLPRLSHQRLSDVPHPQSASGCGGRDPQDLRAKLDLRSKLDCCLLSGIERVCPYSRNQKPKSGLRAPLEVGSSAT